MANLTSTTYPKINSLYKRDMQTGKLIIGDSPTSNLCLNEFEAIKTWLITEKVDGTNVRIIIDVPKQNVRFGGRTKKSQISTDLLNNLSDTFPKEKILNHFRESKQVVLYGEGYGGSIQRGKLGKGITYRPNPSFILFDAVIDGWWLTRPKLERLSYDLDIKLVPSLNIRDIESALEYVRYGFGSLVSEQPCYAEGIVARSWPLMLFRDGTPIMWKLKSKDFKHL